MRINKLLIAIIAMALPAYAAMSDAAAIKKVKTLWGDIGMIGQIRNTTDTNWYKYVGVETKGCRSAGINSSLAKEAEFLVLGKGFNTWDAAFDDVTMNPPTIGGPFAGTIKVQITAHDETALASLQWVVDGTALPITTLMGQTQALTADIPTSTMMDGLHYLCAIVKDSSNNTHVTDPKLFNTNQATGQQAALWGPFGSNGLPPAASKIN